MTNQQLIDELVGNAHGNMARVQEILTQHPDLVNSAARWGETPVQVTLVTVAHGADCPVGNRSYAAQTRRVR